MHLGHVDKAIADINSALKLQPNAAKYDALGTIYYRAGRSQEAIEAFNARIVTRFSAMFPPHWAIARPFQTITHCHTGLFGAPKGIKQEATDEIRARAEAVQSARSRR